MKTTFQLKFGKRTAKDFLNIEDKLPFPIEISESENGDVILKSDELQWILFNLFYAGLAMGTDEALSAFATKPIPEPMEQFGQFINQLAGVSDVIEEQDKIVSDED